MSDINNENTQQFYGVSLAVDSNSDQNQMSETDLIFTNRSDALNTVKKFKGSRFKAFSNIKDAIVFTKEKVLTEVNTNGSNELMKNVEKSLSPFSSPHTRDLTKLRRAIERADLETVRQLVWSNPRYLVSSGDTPVILMEGPRYNAVHIAAKESSHCVLQFILKTISATHFMQLLFPFDKSDVTQSRVNFLLDLYLNTPDKGFCETPLHFGCKFGSLETVSILLSYPICDLEKLNKLGKKASQIICERKGDNIVKSKITKLFEARIYIPLIRDEFSAQIGQPFEGTINNKSISGLAGPMSPEQADSLYQTLKSPRKCTPTERRIRLTDQRKGLERIARNICNNMKVNWIEFWPFLNTFIDLTSNEGLNKLELHLQNIYYQLDSSFTKEETLDCSQKYNHINRSTSDSLTISSLSNTLSKLDIQSLDLSDVEDIANDQFSDVLQSLNPSFTISDITSKTYENLEDYDSDDSNSSYTTAPSTPIFLYNFYINGPKITKEDVDAALAIQHKIKDDECFKLDFIQDWFYRVVREQPQQFNEDNCDSMPLFSTPIKK